MAGYQVHCAIVHSFVRRRMNTVPLNLLCRHCHETKSTRRWNRLPLVGYLKSLKWTPIPISLGFALIAYQQYRHVRRREQAKSGNPVLASDFQLSCYRLLPLRTMSRLWGWINDLDLPVWARRPLLNLYVKSFGCNLSEAQEQDLKQYRNLGSFFRREIKPDVRPVNCNSCLVSPADGLIVNHGLVENDHMEQVKGVAYSLQAFLGSINWGSNSPTFTKISNCDYQNSLLYNKDNCLYHCVIYLAPGDYHRFHSPVDWKIIFRRHFTGDLLSVNPGVASWIAGLFSLNERALYVGKWTHGFFSLTAVGATNVGSIKVPFDKELATNVKGTRKGVIHDWHISSKDGNVMMKKGEFFGEFNLGSSIILIFEAPKDFEFSIVSGQKMKFGQSLH